MGRARYTFWLFLSDIPEGRYRFQFLNNTFIDQFYINDDRRYDNKECRNCNRCLWGTSCFDKQDCWDHSCWDPTHVQPIKLRYLNNQSDNNDWSFPGNKTTNPFRTCLLYNEDGKASQNLEELRVNVFCTYSNNCSCNLTWTNHLDTFKIHFMDSLEVCDTYSKNKSSFLDIHLICTVHRSRYSFGFYQPVTISLGYDIPIVRIDGNTMASPITRTNSKMATAPNILIVLVVLVSLGGIICFITYRYTKRRKDKELTDENQEVPLTICPDLGPNNLPIWLTNRRHLIYDANLITKEKYLGGGVFGKVHKGKISLGNAVYVKYVSFLFNA